MKTNLCGLILLILLPGFSLAQLNKSPGIGASIGITNYLGDLDDNLTLKFSKPGFGFHILKPVLSRVSVRANFFQGYIWADDRLGSFANHQYRGLNFRSPVTEIGINVLLYMRSNIRNSFVQRKLNPYVFAGVAVFKFKPKATYDGVTAALQPLGTEGQNLGMGKPYSLTQISIPLGAGIHYRISQVILIGLESGFRKTFTDYLDDVSTVYPDQQLLAEINPLSANFSNRTGNMVNPGKLRGNPLLKDWYTYTNLNITFFFPSMNNKKDINRNCRNLWGG